MTISEAILTLNANVVVACERAGFASATVKMVVDALDTIEGALQAQEPRVMTLEEVRELQDDVAVWLEDNDKADVIPAIVNHIWNSLPNMASFTAAYAREVKADMLWYGVKWRCWTSRPTDEQREAIPWE